MRRSPAHAAPLLLLALAPLAACGEDRERTTAGNEVAEIEVHAMSREEEQAQPVKYVVVPLLPPRDPGRVIYAPPTDLALRRPGAPTVPGQLPQGGAGMEGSTGISGTPGADVPGLPGPQTAPDTARPTGPGRREQTTGGAPQPAGGGVRPDTTRSD